MKNMMFTSMSLMAQLQKMAQVGVGMCTALISVFTGIPVRSDTAMTGEITLHGQVTKIGGLKEKLLAAKRGGIKRVIIPQDNAADLERFLPKSLMHLKSILLDG